MSDYDTPTTREVRGAFAFWAIRNGPERFDRWLAEHDAALVAERTPRTFDALCAFCGAPGEHVKSPGGSWWAHNSGHHPDDQHEFVPVLPQHYEEE